jgi:aldose sugar dehydrogenase
VTRLRRALAVVPALVAGWAPAAAAHAESPTPDPPRVETVVAHAAFPTNMAFAPDGRLLYVEKETGKIRVVRDGRLLPEPFARLAVSGGGESGLLGLALDPHFETEPFVYVYFTSSADGRNHIARIRASASNPDRGGAPQNLLTLLTASGIHNGGDLAFGADGKLYATVGETGDSALAQERSSLGGKVLRLNPDGSVPSDNPFGPHSPVFTLGLRNSFGLCVNPRTGDLWETENGPSSDDEINLIREGRNYGWPQQLGPGSDPRFTNPVLTFGQIIVPTGCAFFDNAVSASSVEPPASGGQLVFGDFHGDLHSVILRRPGLDDVEQATVVAHFPTGITDVEVGPDGDLYVATSSSIVRIPPANGVPDHGGSPGSGTPLVIGHPPRTTPLLVLAIAAGAAAVVLTAAVLVRDARRRRGGGGVSSPDA